MKTVHEETYRGYEIVVIRNTFGFIALFAPTDPALPRRRSGQMSVDAETLDDVLNVARGVVDVLLAFGPI